MDCLGLPQRKEHSGPQKMGGPTRVGGSAQTWAARAKATARAAQGIAGGCGTGRKIFWGERWDSNPRPPGPQPGALPTELLPPRESSYTQLLFLWQVFFRAADSGFCLEQGVCCLLFFTRAARGPRPPAETAWTNWLLKAACPLRAALTSAAPKMRPCPFCSRPSFFPNQP